MPDYTKLRAKALKNDKKAEKEYYEQIDNTVQKKAKDLARPLTAEEQTDLVSSVEKRAGNIRMGGGTGMDQKTLTASEKKATEQNALNIMANSGFQRFMGGYAEGLTPFPDGADYSTPQGQALKSLRSESTEGKVGKAAGLLSQYLLPYGATEGVAAKAATKILPKAGNVGRTIVQNALQDATVGAALNAANIYGKEGKRGDEALKEFATQEAIDLIAGGIISGVLGKVLKSGKTITKENIADLTDNEIKEVVETLPTEQQAEATRQIRNLKPRKAATTLRTAKAADSEMVDELANTLAETYQQGMKFAPERIDEMKSLYDDVIQNGVTPKSRKTANDITAKIIDDAYVEELDNAAVERLADLRKELKGYKIAIDDFTKKELENASGKKYGDLRKSFFGNTTLVKAGNGSSLDEVYYTLRETYPDILPEADNAYEQWRNLQTVFENGRDKSYGILSDNFFTGNTEDFKDTLLDESVISAVTKDEAQRFKGRAKELRSITQTPTPTEKVAVKTNKSLPTASEKFVAAPEKTETEKPLRFASLREKADKANKMLFDSTAEVAKLGKSAGTDLEGAKQAVRTSNGTRNYILTTDLVDPNGNIILDANGNRLGSYKELMERIPTNELDDFNTYAAHLHNIDRTNQGKPIWLDENGEARYTIKQSKAIVDEMLAKHPSFAKYTKEINNWWQNFTHSWLVDTGRWNEAEWQHFLDVYPNYVPTYRVDKGGIGGAGLGTGKISAGKGYKKAKGGQSELKRIEDDFMEQIGAIVKGARRNELYKEIIGSLDANPTALKGYGVITTRSGQPDNIGRNIIDDIDLAQAETEAQLANLMQIKNGGTSITAYIDGQPITARVSEELADALRYLEDAYGGKAPRDSAAIGKGITNTMKSLITGLNPVFAVANLSRDLPTYLIQSNFPVSKKLSALGKAIEGMTGANKEYRKLFEQYKALGGKESGYYAQGKGFKDAIDTLESNGLWNATKRLMSAIGEGAETFPRFAEFINEIEASGNPLSALNKAADVTVNFAKSGYFTKAWDAWVLYLNAAMQGLEKTARTFKNAPLKTTGKSLTYISAPFMLATAANWDNPNYQMLSDRIKQNYLVIPNLAGEKDDEGNAKTFYKIPLNREYGAIFGGSLNAIMEALTGDENALPTYASTLGTNFLPPSLVTDNILAPLAVNLPNGKDFAGREIVPQYLQGEKPINQKDSRTSGLAKAVSTIANKVPLNTALDSPMKVDYLVDSYGGYLGSLGQAATSGETPLEGIENAATSPFVEKFSTDPRYSSNETQRFYAAKEKATQRRNDSPEDMAEYKVYTQIADKLNDLAKEEREIRSRGGDTKAEIDRLREQRNELAKSAREQVAIARQSPTYYTLAKNIQDKYSPDSGISKEAWAKAYNQQAQYSNNAVKALALIADGLTEEQIRSLFKCSNGEYARALAMADSGISANEVERLYGSTEQKYGIAPKGLLAYEMVGNYPDVVYEGLAISPKKRKAAEQISQAGWTGEQLADIILHADGDNNSYINKNELSRYIESAYNIKSPATTLALYNLLNSSV